MLANANGRRLLESCPASVQEGDVSSSGPSVLASHIGPMVLEALDGFLFVLNPEGLVEFVSKNVVKFLRFSQVSVPEMCILWVLVMDRRLGLSVSGGDSEPVDLQLRGSWRPRTVQSTAARFHGSVSIAVLGTLAGL